MRLIKDFSLLILFFIVVIALGVAYFFTRSTLHVANTTAVVTQMRSLNRLETAQFTIEKIIDVGTTGNSVKQLLFGDRILLIAHGNVIAGEDLSKISKNDIIVSGTSVNLNLPAPEILSSSLDESKTSVYNRSTGILTKGNVNLESQARQIAQGDIEQAACEEHILDVASTNAKNQITALLKSLGFTSITIHIAQGRC